MAREQRAVELVCRRLRSWKKGRAMFRQQRLTSTRDLCQARPLMGKVAYRVAFGGVILAISLLMLGGIAAVNLAPSH